MVISKRKKAIFSPFEAALCVLSSGGAEHKWRSAKGFRIQQSSAGVTLSRNSPPSLLSSRRLSYLHFYSINICYYFSSAPRCAFQFWLSLLFSECRFCLHLALQFCFLFVWIFLLVGNVCLCAHSLALLSGFLDLNSEACEPRSL